MANKDRKGQPVVKTKLEEKIFSSSEPKELYNKFLTHNLVRTWTETFVDQDTGEKVDVNRHEIILEKGVCLNSENFPKVLFHMQTGDITGPIEVSTQSRLGYEVTHKDIPYVCRVDTHGKTVKFLLTASGVGMALDIVRDWCELKYGAFVIIEIKEYDDAIILVDRLRKYKYDEAQKRYINGEIPFEEFLDDVVEDREYSTVKGRKDDDDEPEDRDEGSMKFYKIKVITYRDTERDEGIKLFVVLASDADRAILVINAYLREQQNKYNRLKEEQGRISDVDHSVIVAAIEECKIENITRLIPKPFCQTYIDSGKQ